MKEASHLFYNIMTKDLFQQFLLTNKNMFKGCRLERLYELPNKLGCKAWDSL